MPVALTLLDSWQDSKRVHAVGTLLFSGSYPALGENFDAAIDGLNIPGIGGLVNFGNPPQWNIYEQAGGFMLDGRSIAAVGTLTNAGQATAAKGVIVGFIRYIFIVALSATPPKDFIEVKIGVDANTTMDNLIAAINAASGSGSTYSTNSFGANSLVSAGTRSGSAVVMTAASLGRIGNSIASLSTDANYTWGAVTLTGGIDSLLKVFRSSSTAAVVAAGTLSSVGVMSATETVTIDGKVYTYRAALAVPAIVNEILIGANQTASHLNLLRAINAGAGAGTLYATGTVIHPTVTAVSSDGTTTVINAKFSGALQNAIATTETGANMSWGGATLASGADVIGGADIGAVGVSGTQYPAALLNPFRFHYIFKLSNL